MPFKLDANHQEIVEAFEKLGCLVVDNAKKESYEAGQPDIIVGLPNPYNPIGIWVFVEIKTDTGRLRSSQEKFINDCRERNLPVEVVRSTADVEEMYYLRYLAIMHDGIGECCPGCGRLQPSGWVCEDCILF